MMEKVAKEREKWSEEDSRDWTISTRGLLSENMLRTLLQISKWQSIDYRVTGHRLSPLRDKPKLSGFYNPSRQRCGNRACRSLNEYRWIVSLHDEINEERGT